MSNQEPNFTGGGTVFGYLVSQFRALFGAKVDATGGFSTNQTLTTPIINGLPVPSDILTGVVDPLSETAGIAGLKIAATLAVVGGNLDFATEAANLVFAGPTSGGAAKPTFRALVAADVPGGSPVTSFATRTGAVVPVATDYATYMRSYLAGLGLSNDGSTPNTVLDIAAGSANDSTNARTIQIGAFTKNTTGAWVAGSTNAGMGNGLTIANSTVYHVFEIVNSGTADVYFDTSVTAANAPSSTTAFRRVGSFLTDASAHIIKFWQVGDEFGIVTPGTQTATIGTSISTITLVGIPTGVQVRARIRGNLTNAGSAVGGLIISLAETGSTAAGTPTGNVNVVSSGAGGFGGFEMDVMTNTSAQIGASANVAGSTINIVPHGWFDPRGRNA